MSRWVTEGLLTRKPTTLYPARQESAPGVSPGWPRPSGEIATQEQLGLVSMCPASAFSNEDHGLGFDDERCIHCMKCKHGKSESVDWDKSHEWARLRSEGEKKFKDLPRSFDKSLHIRVIDAGACGACLNEIALLTGPHYNMHRLGFFITPSPRKADVLIVSGPVTKHMRDPLEQAYKAMPEPKRVVAVGACALTGGVFGPSFTSATGVADVLPVDVVVPGCPPPPLAVIHSLLLLTGRKEKAGNIGTTIVKGNLP